MLAFIVSWEFKVQSTSKVIKQSSRIKHLCMKTRLLLSTVINPAPISFLNYETDIYF